MKLYFLCLLIFTLCPLRGAWTPRKWFQSKYTMLRSRFARENVLRVPSEWAEVEQSDGARSRGLSKLLLFLLSGTRTADGAFNPLASPRSMLNQHVIPLRNPFFQGWLVRVVDQDKGRSFIVVLGAFSSRQSNEFDEYYIFSAFSDGCRCEQVESFPSPESVAISGGGVVGSDVTGEGHGQVNTTWSVKGVGTLTFGNTECKGNLRLSGGYHLKYRLKDREFWSERDPDLGGPEGWLAHLPLLLPCHYFVHTVGSECSYSARVPSLFGRSEETGFGFAHVEGNHGGAFPEGWVWSQGIAARNAASLSVVGGRFTIGPVTPVTWVVFFRVGKEKYVFRTTDLDRFKYDVDPVRKRVEIRATRTLVGTSIPTILDMVIESDDRFESSSGSCSATCNSKFGIHIHVPTTEGFSNDPGCRETYTARAHMKVSQRRAGEWVVIHDVVIPLTALEFGGTFQNIHILSK